MAGFELMTAVENKIIKLELSEQLSEVSSASSIFVVNGVAGGEYGVAALPTTFFIDKDGVIREVFTGIVNQAVLEDRIERLIAEG